MNLKKFGVLLLSIVIFSTGFFSPVLATEDEQRTKTTNDNEYVYEFEELTEEEEMALVEEQIRKELNLDKSVKINVYSSEDAVKKAAKSPLATKGTVSTKATGGATLVGTRYFTKKDLGWAGNQPSKGTYFGPKGGSLCWQDGGYPVNASFSVGGYGFSVDIPAGKVPAGVTSQSANCAGNKNCKLRVYKDLTIKCYYYEVWVSPGWLTGTTTTTTTTKLYLIAKYV